MKKFLALTIVIVCSFRVLAQMPGMGMGGGKSIPEIGRLYGKLVDSSGKAIGDATVVLLQNKYDSVSKKNKEVMLKAVTSQPNGDFNFEQLPIFRPLKLKISAVGHKPFEQSVVIQPKMDPNMPKPKEGQMPDLSAIAGALEKDLGKVIMKKDLQELGNVIVSASTGKLRMDIDK